MKKNLLLRILPLIVVSGFVLVVSAGPLSAADQNNFGPASEAQPAQEETLPPIEGLSPEDEQELEELDQELAAIEEEFNALDESDEL